MNTLRAWKNGHYMIVRYCELLLMSIIQTRMTGCIIILRKKALRL